MKKICNLCYSKNLLIVVYFYPKLCRLGVWDHEYCIRCSFLLWTAICTDMQIESMHAYILQQVRKKLFLTKYLHSLTTMRVDNVKPLQIAQCIKHWHFFPTNNLYTTHFITIITMKWLQIDGNLWCHRQRRQLSGQQLKHLYFVDEQNTLSMSNLYCSH
jgi:hypothetical protein